MLSLYDITIPNYIRAFEAAINVMNKAELVDDFDFTNILNEKLADDMKSFNWQVNFATHIGLNGVKALVSGEFRPPQSSLEHLDYQGLIQHLSETVATLKAFDKQDVDNCFGQKLVFKFGDNAVPFSTENFAMNFITPNVYFHVTTLYDILRSKNVPLSKRDYLGQMNVGFA